MCVSVRIENGKRSVFVEEIDELVSEISGGTRSVAVVFWPRYNVNGNSCFCCIDIDKTAELNGYESSTDGISYLWKPKAKGGA